MRRGLGRWRIGFAAYIEDLRQEMSEVVIV